MSRFILLEDTESQRIWWKFCWVLPCLFRTLMQIGTGYLDETQPFHQNIITVALQFLNHKMYECITSNKGGTIWMLTLQLLGAENGAQPLFWQILLNDHGCISSRWLWMALSQRGEEERVSWDREAKHHHAASVGAQRWQSKCKISTWCDSSWPWHKSLRWVTTQSGKLGSMPSKILKIQIFVNFAHFASRQRVVVTNGAEEMRYMM